MVAIESNVQTNSIPVLTRIKEKLIHYQVKLEKKRRCVRCARIYPKTEPKHRSETIFACSCTNTPLCLIPCFQLWHEEENDSD